MNKALLAAGAVLLALATAPSSARGQLPGMPVWNSPQGGTGLLIAADVGRPDSVGGRGTTLGGRVALGFGSLTLSGSYGSDKPSGASALKEYGGTAAYRLIGGTLIPVAVNLQGGLARADDAGSWNTRLTGALGFAVDLPTPGVHVEPWIAPGLRALRVGATSTTNTEFGVAGGLTVRFGLVGVHAALDYQDVPGGGHTTTLGVGLHLDIRPSLGL